MFCFSNFALYIDENDASESCASGDTVAILAATSSSTRFFGLISHAAATNAYTRSRNAAARIGINTALVCVTVCARAEKM